MAKWGQFIGGGAKESIVGKAFAGFSAPSKAYGIMASGVPILAILNERSEIGRTVSEHHRADAMANRSAVRAGQNHAAMTRPLSISEAFWLGQTRGADYGFPLRDAHEE